MTTELVAENRIVAFLDVLGFSEILNRSDWVERMTRICDLIDSELNEKKKEITFNYVTVSDSIVLYSDSIATASWQNFPELRNLCFIVREIQKKCAYEDIW